MHTLPRNWFAEQTQFKHKIIVYITEYAYAINYSEPKYASDGQRIHGPWQVENDSVHNAIAQYYTSHIHK